MTIQNCLALVLLLPGMSAALQAGAAAPAERPNILFLFADDQRPDTVAAFGNPIIKTPNIDRIVENGFRFERAYCMGSMGGAVCVPSRAMLNSGKTLFRVKRDLSGSRLLPEVLRESGYVTFGTGKWHNGAASFLRGFEHGKAVFFGGMSDHTKVPLVDTTPDGKQINKRTGKKFSSTLFADAAVDFLRNHQGDRPFYAYVAFTASHDPRQAPPGYIDMYDPERMPLPENYMPQHPFNNGWMTGRDEALAPWPRPEWVIRHQLAEYYGLITHMDHQIGRILDALQQSGQAENTIVIYSADHGLAVGSHGLLGKQSLYEHSMKTPLVFSGPGIPKGQSRDAFAYLFDIFPTVCELTGVPVPEGVEGKSLAPVWRGESAGVRNSVFTAFSDVMRAVRDNRWKLIRYPHINKTQLFDLKSDPHELNDLSGEERHGARIEELTVLLTDWQKRLGDDQPLTTEKPQPVEIDLSGRERTPDRHQPEWIVRKYFDLKDAPESK